MDYREPIEESDLDLAAHFEVGAESASQDSQGETAPERLRTESVVEKSSSERDATYSKMLAQVQASPPTDEAQAEVAQDASEIHQGVDRDSQLSHLLDIAMTKGVEHAVATAEHLEDYYMLDQLHDTLLHDDFHAQLVQKGLIKDVQ